MLIEIGKTLTMDVDTKRLNDDVMAHVVYIGLRNILMDSHASVTRNDCASDQDYRDQSLATAGKKLESMYAGVVRVAKAKAAGVDRLTATLRKLVIELLPKADRKALAGMSDTERMAKIDELVAANTDALTPIAYERMNEEDRAAYAKAKIAAKLVIKL